MILHHVLIASEGQKFNLAQEGKHRLRFIISRSCFEQGEIVLENMQKIFYHKNISNIKQSRRRAASEQIVNHNSKAAF
jgi:hypothetical protein